MKTSTLYIAVLFVASVNYEAFPRYGDTGTSLGDWHPGIHMAEAKRAIRKFASTNLSGPQQSRGMTQQERHNRRSTARLGRPP